MLDFWRKYLIVVGLLFALTGLEFAFLQDFAGVRVLTDTIAAQIRGDEAPSESGAALASLYLGIVGAVTVFMGSVVVMLALGPFKHRDRWAWTTLAVALTGWYVVDTVVAALAGANVLLGFNTAAYVLVGLPLVATRTAFFMRSQKAGA